MNAKYQLTAKQRKKLVRICIAFLLLVCALILRETAYLPQVMFVAAWLLAGYDVLYKAGKNILFRRKFLDEKFLMSIATIGAFIIGEMPEAAAVMIFYQIGDLVESIAVGRSRRNIENLMDIRPDYANVIRDGQMQEVSPEEVNVEEEIIIKKGERIPMDGMVVNGSSMLDTSALTGESMPRSVSVGDSVISGCVNMNSVLKVKVSKPFEDSTVNRILELVENSTARKSHSEQFITRFARCYTPLVVGAAVLLALIPPLFGGAWHVWLERALIFLVVSCPCAVVLSVPLTFFGGIGSASRSGILVKGSSYLENLAKLGIMVFDKTGTLTRGIFKVTAVHPEKISEDKLLELAAHTEVYSTHPIASSIIEAYGQKPDHQRVEIIEEVAGQGIKARVDGKLICVGNEKMMSACGEDGKEDCLSQACLQCDCCTQGTVIHVSVDCEYAGHILIADEIKEDAAETLKELRKAGVDKTVMLTGDSRSIGEKVAAELSIDDVYCELLPVDKVERVEELLQSKDSDKILAFVGDGINDAPVLARADLGIAMGAMGSDAAIEAADVVLMDDKPKKIISAIKIAQRTLRIARENIIFALGIKFLVLLLGAVGMANLWAAVFADVGVMIIAVLNASRMMLIRNN